MARSFHKLTSLQVNENGPKTLAPAFSNQMFSWDEVLISSHEQMTWPDADWLTSIAFINYVYISDFQLQTPCSIAYTNIYPHNAKMITKRLYPMGYARTKTLSVVEANSTCCEILWLQFDWHHSFCQLLALDRCKTYNSIAFSFVTGAPLMFCLRGYAETESIFILF